MIYDIATFSETGPRPVNEDSVECWRLADGSVIGAIADGLGGMGGGRHASSIAIESIAEAIKVGRVSATDLVGLLKSVHLTILQKQAESEELRSMATTLSLVHVHSGALYGVHCGDTRVMVARGQGIKRLTRDQTEVARLLEEGRITRREYRDYPRKNVLYSALGGPKEPDIQCFSFDIEPADWILLTSDGVHQRVAMPELRDMALGATSASDYVASLKLFVDSRGAVDNFSAAVIRVL